MLLVWLVKHVLICCLNFSQSFKACQSSLALRFICPTLPTLDDSDPGPCSSLSWTPRLSLATAQPSLHRSACTISLSLHARPASALARLGSARLGSARPLTLSPCTQPARPGTARPVCSRPVRSLMCVLPPVCAVLARTGPTRFASRSALPSTPCLPQHSAVIPTRLWPACIPHRAVTRPVEVGRAWPGPLSARCLHTLVQMCLCAACTLVQHSGPHSGPPYRPGPTRPGTQARPLTHVYVCSLMCAFAQTMFSHYGLR